MAISVPVLSLHSSCNCASHQTQAIERRNLVAQEVRDAFRMLDKRWMTGQGKAC